jgi:hypothetical protein
MLGLPNAIAGWACSRGQATRLYRRILPPVLFLLSFGWLVFVRFVISAHPPIATYIAGLAFGAAAVTIWPPEKRGANGTWEEDLRMRVAADHYWRMALRVYKRRGQERQLLCQEADKEFPTRTPDWHK